MRKSKIIYLLVIGMALFVLAGGAWAYTFPDPDPDVQAWQGTSAVPAGTNIGFGVIIPAGPGYVDIIGDPALFNAIQGEVTATNHLKITTNWNPGDDGQINAAVKTAYLFIKQGTNVYAIQLDTTSGTGNYFKNPVNTTTSKDIFSGLTSLIYGGIYNPASPGDVPVSTTDVSPTGTTAVVWSNTTLFHTGNTVDMDLNQLNGFLSGSPWSFVWGTATCANDTIYASVTPQVPEPGIMLLLGLGLVGLAGLRRKFKN